MTTFTAYSKKTTCPYCGVGCGVDVSLLKTTVTDKSKKHKTETSSQYEIEGNQRKINAEMSSIDLTTETQVSTTIDAQELKGCESHPANFGRLCVKGTHLLETVIPDGRLTQPKINGIDCSWQEATSTVAKKMQDTIKKYGPDSVAFYVSGQLLTEDYYVANKLMKGFVGSGNIDTNSRLCMSSAVTAYKRAFGEDLVPCNYEDLEQTDLLVMVGSNAAWTHPVLYQRMEKAKTRNPNLRVVLVDPRKTASSSLSDIHLQIKPGTDTTLFNGLLNFLSASHSSDSLVSKSDNNSALDLAFIEQHTNEFTATINQVSEYSLQFVADACEIDIYDLGSFYKLFAKSNTAITFYSMGVNQSVSGVDNANAIINCHLASGKIGKPGCGPFSITGQPNAMGGREVGGLANMLAAHMDIENHEHHSLVSRFWETEHLTKSQGLKAVDMFEAINEGKIKFIWIMATNPVVSMPNRNKIEAALKKCDTVVVSDCVSKNDTLTFADIALPATGWSEKDGTVTNSERRISRQRALFPPLGNARHDWQIICDVAKEMGFESAFSYKNPSEIFAEHCMLTGFENDGTRALDLSGLSALSNEEYENLEPIQWPVTKNSPSGTHRLFANKRFYTANRKANFVPIIVKLPEQQRTEAYPYILNTGRSRDQWHTMTRTGNAARLHEHSTRCELHLCASDAKNLGLKSGDIASVCSSVNASANTSSKKSEPVLLPVNITSSQRKGEMFAPIHWSKSWSSHVNIASLFTDAHDALSGQPELKHAAVSVTKQEIAIQANLYSKIALPTSLLERASDYWTITKLENGFFYHLALLEQSLQERFASGTALEKTKLPENQQNSDYAKQWYNLLYNEVAMGTEFIRLQTPTQINALKIIDNQLSVALFIHSFGIPSAKQMKSENSTEEAAWINHIFSEESLEPEQVTALLSKMPSAEFTEGKLICSCHKVREKTIIKAIEAGATTLDILGKKLKCGTNCGSCKSELTGLIERTLDKNSSASSSATASEITSSKSRSLLKTSEHQHTLIPVRQLEASK